MSTTYRAYLIAGCPYREAVTTETVNVPAKRYHELTGNAYQIEVPVTTHTFNGTAYPTRDALRDALYRAGLERYQSDYLYETDDMLLGVTIAEVSRYDDWALEVEGQEIARKMAEAEAKLPGRTVRLYLALDAC
jgi:hypothetical protein